MQFYLHVMIYLTDDHDNLYMPLPASFSLTRATGHTYNHLDH